MKKVIIIGAGGSLAKYVIDELSKLSNVALTLFVRNSNNLTKSFTTRTTVIEGDALNYRDVKNAIEGQDIVYVNLSGNLKTMANNIVKAMEANNVKRIIAISSIGIYETPLKSVLIPYRALADTIEKSGLDYTIVRPDWFSSDNEIDYTITHKSNPEIGTAVSRKSIASFISKIVQDPVLYSKDNVGISKPD